MLTSNNLIPKMLASFPNLKTLYQTGFDSDEKKLLHIVFGQLFKPYIKSVFSNGDIFDKKRIAEFLELMAISPDNSVVAVLTDTVIEELLDDLVAFKNIEPHLYERTATLTTGIKSALGYSN